MSNYEKNHMFNVGIAEKYGVNEAIILQHFYLWYEYVRTNNLNKHDNTWWFYHSIAAFQEQMPYMSLDKIRTCLSHLAKEELIKKGNYNPNPYDHTAWYTITAKGLKTLKFSIVGKSQIESGKIPLRKVENPKSTIKKLDKELKKGLTPIKNKIPPALSEVKKYIQDNNYSIDAEDFIDFYESKGWLIGKNKMKDWQAAIRTWERNNKQKKPKRREEIPVYEPE